MITHGTISQSKSSVEDVSNNTEDASTAGRGTLHLVEESPVQEQVLEASCGEDLCWLLC